MCIRDRLLRVPGIGQTSVGRIIAARKHTKLTYQDLKKMRVVLKGASHFILCNGKYYGRGFNENLLRLALIAPEFLKAPPEQIPLFDYNLKMLSDETMNFSTFLPPPALTASALSGQL